MVCGLGVGAHFESWGYSEDKIIEADWHEKLALEDGFIVFTTPARHFSGRKFKRNTTVWQSYVLQTPSLKLFLGGDSGYDTHFKEIGEKHGPFDLAILENGQYNEAWRAIHMHPDEVLKASQDLKATRLFPIHSSKFALANHAWDTPLKDISELNKKTNIPLITAKIGEIVELENQEQLFENWWIGVE